MRNLVTMVGIPGSGKTTIAKNYAEAHQPCVVLSSDDIREELYGDANVQGDGRVVFKTLEDRIVDFLNRDYNVVYDATNISKKKRRHIVRTFKANHICIFVNTDIEVCYNRNSARDRHVPNEVIERMYTNLEEPLDTEGFSEIIKITG